MDKLKELLNNTEPELEDLGNSQPIHITENKHVLERTPVWLDNCFIKIEVWNSSPISAETLQVGLTVMHMGHSTGRIYLPNCKHVLPIKGNDPKVKQMSRSATPTVGPESKARGQHVSSMFQWAWHCQCHPRGTREQRTQPKVLLEP